MRYGRWLVIWVVCLGWWLGAPRVEAMTPTPAPVMLTAPVPHQVVRGLVRVLGATEVPGFRQADLYFGYADDPTQTWFLIDEKHIPTHGGLIARWDTTVLTDGDYVLRLVVTTASGSRFEVRAPVRVRNYTPVETPTPGLLAGGTLLPTPTATLTPTATPRWPTPTPLPPNPVVLTDATLVRAMGWGVAAVVVLLAFFGLLRRFG